MVLDGRKLQPVRFQDFIRLPDFGKVVIGNTYHRDAVFAFVKLCQFFRPFRSAPYVVNPVDIEPVKVHQLKLHLNHICHCRGFAVFTLRCEFVGYQIRLSRKPFEKPGQYFFGSAHAVCIRGIQAPSAILGKFAIDVISFALLCT